MNIPEILQALQAGEISSENAKKELTRFYQNRLEHSSSSSSLESSKYLLKQGNNCPESQVKQPSAELAKLGTNYGLVLSTVHSLSEVTLQQWVLTEPEQDEVTIQVKASALNFPDTMCVKGLYPTMPEYPFVPGFEVSGVIMKLGNRSSEFKVGDEVIGLTGKQMGGHAGFVNVPVKNIVHKPKNISFEEACSMPVIFTTVYYAFTIGKLSSQEHVLIQTATGGCGLLAIQLANLKGCVIYGTSSRQEKLDIMHQLGIPFVLNYKTTEFDQEIKRITNQRGVDIVLNTLSGDAIQKGLNCLAPAGRYLEIAVHALKTSSKLDLSKLVQNQSFHSIDLRQLSFQEGFNGKEILNLMQTMIHSEKIVPIVSRIYPLHQIKEALEYVAQGNHIGKVVISHTKQTMIDCTQDCIQRLLEQKQNCKTTIPLKKTTFPVAVGRLNEPVTEGIAIIGMSGQFPMSDTLDRFWQNLAQGKDCISEIPATRWMIDKYFDTDPKMPGKTYCRWMGVLEDVDKFDPLFFNIAPAEAELMDPQQRLFLENCWHCIEDAGLIPASLSGSRTGVFVGCGIDEYGHLMNNKELNAQGLIGGATSILPARISYLLNLKGPCLAIDTACSSSLVAIAEACNSLILREIDLALAGGVSVISGPAMHIMTSKTGMLSKDGRCFTFDARANGFVPGEGVGVVLLKRLSDAIQDCDPIWGVIRGWGINQDGKTNGITAPSVNSQILLEKEVYQRFGINPETISLVEAHGTGTKLGDPIEVEALIESFRAFTTKTNYCALGSVKSNIGHPLAAAGVSGAIKVLLAMRKCMLPPTINFETLNEHISIADSPFYINTELQPWVTKPGVPKRACVSSFGFSGTNAHIIFEEYPPRPENSVLINNSNQPLLFILSAKNGMQLKMYAEAMKSWLESNDGSLMDMVYTLQVGREAMNYRLALVVESRKALLHALEEYIQDKPGAEILVGSVQKSQDGEIRFEADATKFSLRNGLQTKELIALGELWLKGLPVDWHLLYDDGSKPQRISLPNYPFVKERYWLPEIDDSSNMQRNAGNKLLPLIDSNVSTLDEYRFQKVFSGAEVFLEDADTGEKVVPGLILLEMARMAGNLLTQKAKILRITKVRWGAPIVITDNLRAVDIDLFPDGDVLDYEISTTLNDNEKIVHTQGRLNYEERDVEDEPEFIDIRMLKERCSDIKAWNRKNLPVSEFYYHGNEVLANYQLSVVFKEEFEGYVFQPCLLQSILQIVNEFSMLKIESAVQCLPLALDEVIIGKSVSAPLYLNIIFNDKYSFDDGIISANIQILDETGQVLAKMNNFSAKVLPLIQATPLKAMVEFPEVLYYQTQWQLVGKDIKTEMQPLESILIFDRNEELYQMLQQRAVNQKAEGSRVFLVKPGANYLQLGRHCYEINPDSQEDYLRLLTELKTEKYPPEKVLYLWTEPLNFEHSESLASQIQMTADIHNYSQDWTGCFQFRSVYHIFGLLKALMEFKVKSLTRFVIVNTNPKQEPNPFNESLIGYAKSLAMTWPKLLISSVELAIANTSPEIVDILIRELDIAGKDFDYEVRYDHENRYVKRVTPLKLQDVHHHCFKKHGVYLITGGAGGLGLIFARYLAENYQARLVLIGRSKLEDSKLEFLEELKQFKADVVYLAADVTDQTGLQVVMQSVKEKFGVLNGVIHAAGVTDNRTILHKNINEYQTALSPKLTGTILIDEVTQNEPLDFFIMFSSVSSILGDFGQCDYAIGNRFMDSYATLRETLRARKTRQGQTIVINWPLWKDGGMHFNREGETLYLQSSGMIYLDTQDGLRTFEKIIGNDVQQVIIFFGIRERIEHFLKITADVIKPVIPSRNRILVTSTVNPRCTTGVREIPVAQQLEFDLQKIAAGVIKISFEKLGVHENLGDFGFDSIYLKEFSNRLSETFGIEISPTVFFSYSSLHRLGEYIFNEFPEATSRFYEQPESNIEIVNIKERPLVNDEMNFDLKPLFNQDRCLQRNHHSSNYQGWSLEPIAIIGMSGVFPGSKDVDEFWRNLAQQKDLISEIPKERWNWQDYYHPADHENNHANSKWGGFIDDVDKFDAQFFNISPLEAEFMDPQHRLFLETVWKTVEDSGYKMSQLSGENVGVFAGIQFHDYQQLLIEKGFIQAQIGTGNAQTMLPNRVSYLFNFKGPSESFDTACSSSLVAIHRAVNSIQMGESELAIVGGISLMLAPYSFLVTSQLGMFAPDGRCKTFDKSANGFVKGEGVGALLLKPLKKAVADQDHIYAVIKGTAINHGGKANSLTAPNSEAQAALLINAYKKAGISPDSVSYIETHGTGTELGDPVEIEGLKKAFQEMAKHNKKKKDQAFYCGLGSVKTNIGHLEPAAGIAGITKVILAMQHKQIPGNLHFEELNPYIDLKNSPFYIVDKTIPWENLKDNQGNNLPRCAGVSAFGFGGVNAHIVLEEYVTVTNEPPYMKTKISTKPNSQIILLSAKNETSLKEYARAMVSFLENTLPISSQQTSKNLLPVVRKDIIAKVAAILRINEADAVQTEELTDFGFDLIQQTAFTDWINEKYHLELKAFLFSEYPTLDSLIQYFWEEYSDVFVKHYQGQTKAEPVWAPQEPITLAEIAYTLQFGREVMNERLALVVSDMEELCSLLRKYYQENVVIGNIYHGNIKTSKINTNLLVSDKTGEDFTKILVDGKEFIKLAQLWVAGVEIDWKPLYQSWRPNRISMPTYQFMRERYWIPQNNPVTIVNHNPNPPLVLDKAYYLLEKTWLESPKNRPVASHFKGLILMLVNDETEPFATQFVLHDDSVKLIKLRNHTIYKKRNVWDYNFDFAQAEQGARIAREILQQAGEITAFIDLSDLNSIPLDYCPDSMGKIMLLQELIKKSSLTSHDPFIVLHLTKGLQVFKNEQPTLQGANFAGLIKILSAEYHKLQSRTVDIDFSLEDGSSIRRVILQEMGFRDLESEICYRNEIRYVPSMRKLDSRALSQLKSLSDSIHPDKIIVITGGTRGIGAEVAKYLAKKGARKLVLLGIQEIPPHNQWESLLNNPATTGSITDKIKILSKLERDGVTIELFTGSLAKRVELNKFFNKIRRKLGEIGGVIHCAGLAINDSPAFINKNYRDMQKVFEPKVTGLKNLAEIFKRDQLDFFILFSSVSALIPVLATGVSDYAAANAFMDYFAAYQFRKGKTYFKAINWPSWDKVGMGVVDTPIYRQLGLGTLDIAEGLLLLDYALSFKEYCCITPCIAAREQFDITRLLQIRQDNNIPAKLILGKENKPLPPVFNRNEINNLKKQVKEFFSTELRIPEAKFDEDTNFGDLGVDSIILADIVKKMEKKINQNLDPSIFLEYPTINLLSNYLSQKLMSKPLTQENTGLSTDQAINGAQNYEYIATQTELTSRTGYFKNRIQMEELSGLVKQSKIAVIGMACHFPGAKNTDEFWKNLKAGKSSITEVPKSRWDINRYYDPGYHKGKSISKWGGFIDNIENFDPDYFNIGSDEAYHMDPLIRQFLEVSVQTLRDAGYPKEELWNKKIGVFVGSRVGNFASKIEQPQKNSIIGLGQNFIAAHVAHFFNFRGPNLVVDSACSSSLVSIHLACQSIMMQESELAIAGGVDILLDEKPYIGLSEGRALSPDGKCHTFDEKANGFVPGEGCGAVLLKSLTQAIADGDQIYAVIDASAVNNDGHTMGITTPNPEAQTEVIREALTKGDIDPNTISYIETHGTGTMIGDPIELKALTKVFRQSTVEKEFCAVGSVKTNIGHLLTAAGIASFIKVVLAIQHQQLPPTLNCEIPNPRFEFFNSPFYPNTQLKEWKQRNGLRRAGISSFGFGGTNAHIILSECDQSLLGDQQRHRLPLVDFNHQRYWLEETDSMVENSSNNLPTLLALEEEIG